MPLRLIEAEEEHRPVIERLLQLFLHDLSEFTGFEPGDDACYDLPGASEIWTDPSKHALLFLLRGKPAGFALVHAQADNKSRPFWRLDEFFIVRGYRRLGIGEEVARMVFDLYQGEWRIHVSDQNDIGLSFWRQVLRRYTLRKFRELRFIDSKEFVFEFVSPTPDPISQT